MADLVINDRRRETRRLHGDSLRGAEVHVPGARVLEVLDHSPHGLRCRLTHLVRPGRPMALRLPEGAGLSTISGYVLRCEVCRLTRQSVQYEAAWHLERPWRCE